MNRRNPKPVVTVVHTLPGRVRLRFSVGVHGVAQHASTACAWGSTWCCMGTGSSRYDRRLASHWPGLFTPMPAIAWPGLGGARVQIGLGLGAHLPLPSVVSESFR